MHRRMIAVLATACMAGAGCDQDGAGDPADVQEVEARPIDPALAAHLPEGVPMDVAEAGRDLYPECGVCHGLEGQGTALGSALADSLWTRGSGEIGDIAALVRSGVESPGDFPVPMPAYGASEYSDDEVQALATYVFMLSRNGPAPD